MRVIAALLFLLALTGCSGTPKPVIHPGALNQFDSNAYDTLLTAQAAIEQASKEVVANYPALKDEMNKVRAGYTAAQASYKSYHEAAAAGKPTTPDALDALLKKLTTDLAAILAKLKPKPIGQLIFAPLDLPLKEIA